MVNALILRLPKGRFLFIAHLNHQPPNSGPGMGHARISNHMRNPLFNSPSFCKFWFARLKYLRTLHQTR